MRFSRFMVLALILLVLTVAAPAARTGAGNRQSSQTIEYALDESSMYIVGCFGGGSPPCGGALFEIDDFNGGFKATEAGVDREGFTVYKLNNIAFTVGSGDGQFDIVGTGVYRRTFGTHAAHQLKLSVITGGELVLLDSGIVAVPDSPHAIDIGASINGGNGYDMMLLIVADPSV